MNDNQQLCLLAFISLGIGYFLYDIFRYMYKNLDMKNNINFLMCYTSLLLSIIMTFILPLSIFIHLG